MNYVVFSASAQSDAYCFTAIPCAHLWRLAGWEPVILMMGGWNTRSEWDLSPRGQYVRRHLCSNGFITQPVGVGKDPWMRIPEGSHNPGFHSSTMCRRIACASGMFAADDVVVLGDVDMLVLDGSVLPKSCDSSFVIVGADYFPLGPGVWQRYPSCYQIAEARTWREIMMRRGSPDTIERDTYMHMLWTEEYCRKTNGEFAPGKARWDCEPSWGALLDPWSERNPSRLSLIDRSPGTSAERRLILQANPQPRHIHCADPIDCHVRDRWLSDANWQILMANSPRVPAEMRALFSQLRAEYLSLETKNAG
jgi:hypothetical protein